MNVEFFSTNPRQKSRSTLDNILSRGGDQLAIACAYCTGAEVEILKNHVGRLKGADSFVVVSVDPPTDYAALETLHKLIPGHLFVHWGARSPVEVKAGAAIMHSKVFYARAGTECWLWTGSHNLTGNATQGGNCEAAVLLSGSATEKPFKDALSHLIECRNEATPYDPDAEPPVRPERTDIVVIHAETDATPSRNLPWHIHLCLNTADFDGLLGPPADVELFLYKKGSLSKGWRFATPVGSYAGALTGQNLTANNPRASKAGTSAAWGAANFSITEQSGILVLGPDSPPGPLATTQAVIYINEPSDPNDILLSEEPKIERKMHEGTSWLTPVDADMRQFFKKSSRDASQLVHRPFVGRSFVIRAPAEETRERDLPRLRDFLAPDRPMQVELNVASDAASERRHPFIVRARYRVRGE